MRVEGRLGEESAYASAYFAKSFFQARFALAQAFPQEIDLIAGSVADFPERWFRQGAKTVFDVLEQAKSSLFGSPFGHEGPNQQPDGDSRHDRCEQSAAGIAANTILDFVISLFDRPVRFFGNVFGFDHSSGIGCEGTDVLFCLWIALVDQPARMRLVFAGY